MSVTLDPPVAEMKHVSTLMEIISVWNLHVSTLKQANNMAAVESINNLFFNQ